MHTKIKLSNAFPMLLVLSNCFIIHRHCKTIKVQDTVTTLKISSKKEVYTKKLFLTWILTSQQSDRRSNIRGG